MTYYEIPHEIDNNPNTNIRLAELVKSMKEQGWQGRPLLANGNMLYTGSHRYTSSQIAEIVPCIHQMEIALDFGDDDDWMLYILADACDDQSKYLAIKQLHDFGYIDTKSLELIEVEYKTTS